VTAVGTLGAPGAPASQTPSPGGEAGPPGWARSALDAPEVAALRFTPFAPVDDAPAGQSSLQVPPGLVAWSCPEGAAWPPGPALEIDLAALGRSFGRLSIALRPGETATAAAVLRVQLKAQAWAAAEARLALERATVWQTASLEAEQRRLDEAQTLLDLAEAVGRSGSFRWSPADGGQVWTKTNFELHGYDPQVDVPGYAMCIARMHPDDLIDFQATVDQGVEAAREIRVEYRLVMPTGQVRHALARARPFASGDWIGSVVDVSELRAAEDAIGLTQAALAKGLRVTTMGELAAAIAHEVNQPLTSIAANAGAALRWLNRDAPNDERAILSLDNVRREARRAGEIIQGLHALARRAPPRLLPLSGDQIVRDIAALLRPNLERQGVQLRLDLQAGDRPALGEAGQIKQVLMNLMSNAVEAMAENGQEPKILQVTTRAAATGDVELTVADTGPGLQGGAATRAFEPFFSTKSAGMGLGLAICRSIVERHEGTLEAASAQPRGAVFRVRLRGAPPSGLADAS